MLGNPVQAVWKSWVVNAEAENQDRILSLIDRGYSPDGAFKSSFGQENINWFRGNPPLDKIPRWSEADFPGWGDGWWGHTAAGTPTTNLEKYNRPNSGLGAYLEIMKHEIMGVYMHGRQPLRGAASTMPTATSCRWANGPRFRRVGQSSASRSSTPVKATWS